MFDFGLISNINCFTSVMQEIGADTVLEHHKLTFQYVQADSSQLVNVRVVDFGHEAYFRRGHGIFLREEQL